MIEFKIMIAQRNIADAFTNQLFFLTVWMSLSTEILAFHVTRSTSIILKHQDCSNICFRMPTNECGPSLQSFAGSTSNRKALDQTFMQASHSFHHRYLQCRHRIVRMASRGETVNTGLRRAEQWRNKGKVVWNVEREMKSTPPIVHVVRFIVMAFIRAIAVAWVFRAVQKLIPSLTAMGTALSNFSPESLMTLLSCALTAVTAHSANILLLLRGSRNTLNLMPNIHNPSRSHRLKHSVHH